MAALVDLAPGLDPCVARRPFMVPQIGIDPFQLPPPSTQDTWMASSFSTTNTSVARQLFWCDVVPDGPSLGALGQALVP
jgi:hypothetical protein